ncbi:polysaccharide biosynthesis/export family protein [soil metagenome]
MFASGTGLHRRSAVMMAALVMLQGCAMLPASAPTVGQVMKNQAVAGHPIEVVDLITAPAAVDKPLPVADVASWSIADAPGWSGQITPGDLLSVTVFEVGYGLFAPPPATDGATRAEAAPSAAGHTLPALEINAMGEIDLPYVGHIRVVGATAEQVAREIEGRLQGYSQHAQVVVSVTRGLGRTVLLSGDVHQPGRQPLSPAGERLLDVIAQAGGPSNRAADTDVVLTRDGQNATIRLDRLQIDSRQNVRLAPGDHIALRRNVRSLTVLGAARSVSEVPFDSDQLTLAEALARAGGPLDERADATGVFVFRYVSRMIDGHAVAIPTIYRLNLLDPRGYFAVQRFTMREKDVLLIANARSAQFAKLVTLLNQFVSPAITVDLLTR